MTFSLKKLIGGQTASANVVGGYLVLSLPNALEPVVWRMALDKIGTAMFEVKQNSDSATAKLILKPKKGVAEIIAPFENKKEAVEALMIASAALQKAESYAEPLPVEKISARASKNISDRRATYVESPKNTGTEAQKWFLALIGVFLVIGLYYYLTTLMPERINGFDNAAAPAGMAASAPQEATGVPVSADEFLNGL